MIHVWEAITAHSAVHSSETSINAYPRHHQHPSQHPGQPRVCEYKKLHPASAHSMSAIRFRMAPDGTLSTTIRFRMAAGGVMRGEKRQAHEVEVRLED